MFAPQIKPVYRRRLLLDAQEMSREKFAGQNRRCTYHPKPAQGSRFNKPRAWFNKNGCWFQTNHGPALGKIKQEPI